jgi:hypothetical protein
VDRKIKNGFIVGFHHPVSLPKSATNTGVEAASTQLGRTAAPKRPGGRPRPLKGSTEVLPRYTSALGLAEEDEE